MRALADILFPPVCLSCGARTPGALCATCDGKVRWLTDDVCARCGRPGGEPGSCRDCDWLRPAFTIARAAALYTGPARDALMGFKLGGERRAARALGAIMARAIHASSKTYEPAYDTVTFVPATPRSERVRGFNPAEELARAVARASGTPLRTLLAKTRDTVDQAALDRAQRKQNQRDAYRARLRAPQRVLLVDDIFTTGATADSCARALKAAGTSEVAVLTFARAI